MSGQYQVWRLTALLFFVSMALIVGFPSSYAQGGEKSGPPDGMATVSPPVPMPEFSLPHLNGEVFQSSALQGQVVVVRFWATW
jgi:cytochrome oxidase Cu insertion factor (SCO1/SenC/PrrC family)